jgi:hypothetical protein
MGSAESLYDLHRSIGAVCAENLVRLIWWRNHVTSATMVGLLSFLLRLLLSPFRPISRLEAENAALDVSW